MKKVKEYKKKKLSIRFPYITVTTKIDEGIKLNKGDYIKLKVGQNVEIFAKVTTSQYESEKNLDKIEVDEVDPIENSNIKEVFMI